MARQLTPLGRILLMLSGLSLLGYSAHKYGLLDKLKALRKPGAAAPQATTPASTTAPATTAQVTGRGGSPWTTIPAGRFQSGPDGNEVDSPAFRIHTTEVTNREYRAYLALCAVGSDCGPRELPSYWDDAGYLDTHLDYPVVFVSWGEAAGYCRWAGGRLPSAREWEMAARGTDGRMFPWGSTLDYSFVNILGPDKHGDKNKAPKQIPTWDTTDARYKRDASPYGVLAMAGNVSEWTSSPSKNEPNLMLIAGGSWDSWDFADGRTYHRIPKPPTDRSSSVGFRCASDR